MTTIIIVLIAITLPAYYVIRHIKKDQRKKEKRIKLATAFERLLLQNSFISERYEIIGDSVLAIDRKNKKLAVVDMREEKTSQYCISLDEVIHSQIVEERNDKGYIQKIILRLKRKRDNAYYDVCFFCAASDLLTDLPRMAKQAFNWKARIELYKRPGTLSVVQDYAL